MGPNNTIPSARDASATAEFYRDVVESAWDAILTSTLDGVVTSWNLAAERMYGYRSTEIVGQPIFQIVPKDRHSEVRAVLEKIRRGERAEHFQTVRVSKCGRRFDVSLTVSPIKSEEGETIGASTIARDISNWIHAEERFRRAVESSPSGMIMVDVGGIIQLANAETETMFGYSSGELLGRNVDELVPARLREEHVRHRLNFADGPQARRMGAGRELYGLRKDGGEFPIEVALNPIETAEGLLVLGVIIDITERKQAENKFRLAVESSPNGVIMADGGGRILLVNRETERLFGYAREELLGQSVDMLVPERIRANHSQHRETFARQPDTRRMGEGRDLYGMRKDGSEFPIEVGLNPIQTPEGLVILSVVVDISERKRSAERIAKYTEELKRSNAELEQFAYVASHDLQEPLRMVASYTELLAQRYSGQLDEKASKYIFYAVDGAKRMKQLVNDLLEFSRVGTRAKPLAPTDPNRTVERVLRDLSAPINETNASVTVGPLPIVSADAVQLEQVFQNLIGNALKFRTPHTPPSIHVSAIQEDGMCRFAIQDNGIGIDAQFADRIFLMFQRLHTREEYPGSGIGLAIAKKIVERHGGRLWVESVPTAGATFYFTVPSARSSLA